MINAKAMREISNNAVGSYKEKLIQYFENTVKPELENIIKEKASKGRYFVYYQVHFANFLDYPFSPTSIISHFKKWLEQYGYEVTVMSHSTAVSEISIRWGILEEDMT